MSLPPATKLPLALRKNVRDKFEDKKADLEASLTKGLLGTAWTIECDPLALYPYAEESYPKESLGSCLYEYFDRAITSLDWSKEPIKKSVNELASKHVLGIEIDTAASYNYSSCAIKDGKLIIQIAPKGFGINVGEGLGDAHLHPALNAASLASGATISFLAKRDLDKYFTPNVDQYNKDIATILGKPVKLNPRLEENFAALKDASKKPSGWEDSFGCIIDSYFNSFIFSLRGQKFEGDEMLQEGFFDAVDKGEIALRIVDKLSRSSYCESVIEDGVLYMQTTADEWGTNSNEIGQKIVDLL